MNDIEDQDDIDDEIEIDIDGIEEENDDSELEEE